MNPWTYYGARTPEFFAEFVNAEEAGLEPGTSATALKVWSWLLWKAFEETGIAKKASARAMARKFGGRREKFSAAVDELAAQKRIRKLPGSAIQLCLPGRPGEFMQFQTLAPSLPLDPREPLGDKLQVEQLAPREPVEEGLKHANPNNGSQGATSDKAANPAFVRIRGQFEGDSLLRTSRWDENQPTTHLPTGDELRRARSMRWSTPGLRPLERAKPGERGGIAEAGSAAGESLAALRGEGGKVVGPGNGKLKREAERPSDEWPAGVDPDDPYLCPPMM